MNFIKPFSHSLTRREYSEASGHWGEFIYLFKKYLLDTYSVLCTLLGTVKTDTFLSSWSLCSKEERQVINNYRSKICRRVKNAIEKIEKEEWKF